MADPIKNPYTSAPTYLTAADNHNLGNTGTSWMEPETYGEKFGNLGKFISVSAISGVSSFYNTAMAVGKWVGFDTQETDTLAFVSSLDSDLGAYYRTNREAADLTGFIAGSLIPGLAGVKALNMGQTALKAARTEGMIGGNLAKATGLLTPDSQKYVRLAAAEINSSLSTTKLVNANTLRAIGAGTWQGVLETAAFETMVQATMFKSPILEQQDVGDIFTNIAIGGAVGGVFAGAFTAPGVFGKLKQLVGAEKEARMPFTQRPAFAERTPASEKIVELAWDTEASAWPISFKNAKGELVENNFAVNNTLYQDKVRKNLDEIRTNIHTMVDGADNDLGNMVANASMPRIDTSTGFTIPGYSQNYLESFSGSVAIARPTAKTRVEMAMEQAVKKGEVPETGLAFRWVKLTGEDAGTVFDSMPQVLSLADMAPSQEALRQSVKAFGFGVKPGKMWNPLELSGKTAHLEAEARQIWADHMLQLDAIKPGTLIHEMDFPVLEKIYKNWDDFHGQIKIQRGEGPTLETWTPGSKTELFNLLKENKVNAAVELMPKLGIDTETTAKIVNVKTSYLEGSPSADEVGDLFATMSAKTSYLEELRNRGVSLGAAEATDPALLPKYAKVVYKVDQNIKEIQPHVADALTYFRAKQKIYEENAKNTVAKVLGEGTENLPDLGNKELARMDHTHAGAGFVSFANSNYGTWGSTMQWIGAQTRGFKERFRKEVGDNLTPVLSRMASKPEAAIEFESINQKISRSGKLWVTMEDDAGKTVLVKREDALAIRASNGERTLDDLDEFIPIENAETAEAVRAHIQQSGGRTTKMKELRAQQGHVDNKDPEVFRPIRPDLKQYPHFAFVVDDSVSGSGHKTMIHAASEKELIALLDKVPVRYRKIYKTDAEEFYKARQEYEFSRTLNENYIDSDLASKGVFSNFFPKTDPEKIVNDVLNQHLRESDTTVVEAIRLRYERQFGLLEDLGKNYSRAAASKFATKTEQIEKVADNPYFNHIKTALDISKLPENTLLYSFNKSLDEAVSKFHGALKNTWDGVKSPAELETINAQLDKYGMKPAFYDAALNALANHQAPKGSLTKFVRQANSLLSLFTLGLDPLNSLNNAIGSNILRMSELKHLTDAIRKGNTEVAGELAAVAKIKLPGAGDEILAPTKLVAKAIQNFWKDDGKLMTKYKDMGLIKDRAEQLKMLVDDFTLKGTETVAELEGRVSAGFQRAKDLAEKGETLSGNKLAEEFNRFISANVMEQITAIGMKAGLLDDATSRAYINTFVNRVEGNIVASQRPLVFQGPIGQAIGLFQSYQFNLLQQLFRYVGEGSAKDIAMLAGLQSTLYGVQSLPAFQFMNVHVLGQLSGNTEHRDAYDSIYGIVGKTAGDFVLYGLPSNILQTNIYSRGDINPRQITVLPTSLQEIPIVQGWGKFLGSMKDTAKKIMGGGEVWESFLQGMEHNGISRPLAGFAQTLRGLEDGQVFSTQKSGNFLYGNDLLSLATLSRLAGGRPLDEAITNDALFRVKTYDAARKEDMKSLASKVKTHLVGGGEASSEAVNQFAESFAKNGGKQAQFNQWMMGMYKDANVSQAEQLRGSLTQPFAYKMQVLMGGQEE